MRFKAVASVVLLAVAASSLLGTAAAAQGAQRTPKVMKWQGKKLPSMKMTTISGRTITNRTLRGKVVIIDFWATWCGPCKAASPIMQKMHSKYGSRGLVVIGANVFEDPKVKGQAKGYASEHKYTYTFTVKNDGLAKKLEIEGIPTMLIVDKGGRIARVIYGYGADLETQLTKTISKLL